ncbi:MAG: GNAT family N-acetyltransferase [Bacteroidota bacterium]
MEISFKTLNQDLLNAYITVGKQSYREHYLHLWNKRNPKSYFEVSFSESQVHFEIGDLNCENYLVQYGQEYAGILKLSKHRGWGPWPDREALYLHRIYLLRAFSGKGIGSVTLQFVEAYARKLGKKVIWLETMKKGKALNFYNNNGFEIAGETQIDLQGVLPDEKEMWVLTKKI